MEAHRKLWGPVETAADCGLRLTHRTEDLAWPGTQKKKKKCDVQESDYIPVDDDVATPEFQKPAAGTEDLTSSTSAAPEAYRRKL